MAGGHRSAVGTGRLDPAAAACPHGLLPALAIALDGGREVRPAPVPRAARAGRALVHTALNLHAAVPQRPRPLRVGAAVDVVGRRAGGVALLDGARPLRRGRPPLARHLRDLPCAAGRGGDAQGGADALHRDGTGDETVFSVRRTVGRGRLAYTPGPARGYQTLTR